MEINLRDTTSQHILHMHPPLLSLSSPSSLPCRPVQYIHHSFINSENSSLVNCLGKFNFKRKLLKEKDIIKLQGSLCPLPRSGWGGVGEGVGAEGTCAASCAALHRTAPCQGSHTPMFKAERYVKPPPLHRLTAPDAVSLPGLLKVPKRTGC